MPPGSVPITSWMLLNCKTKMVAQFLNEVKFGLHVLHRPSRRAVSRTSSGISHSLMNNWIRGVIPS